MTQHSTAIFKAERAGCDAADDLKVKWNPLKKFLIEKGELEAHSAIEIKINIEFLDKVVAVNYLEALWGNMLLTKPGPGTSKL